LVYRNVQPSGSDDRHRPWAGWTVHDMSRWQHGIWTVLRAWPRRTAGRGLMVAAALTVAVPSAVSRWWPGIAASVLVAVAGVAGATLSARAAARMAEAGVRARQIDNDLFLDERGRLPRVCDLDDPVRVGVYPAADAGDPALARTPPFVRRDRSADLDAALQRGGFVLVAGESTAGKSRSAYESMRACLPEHVFIWPASRAGMRTALEAVRRERRSVVWLDDLQSYLGGEGLTSQLLERLLGDGTRHVAVLATMRVEERARRRRQEGFGDTGLGDSAREWREVLDRAVEIRIARNWTVSELARARGFAGDRRIAAALSYAGRFGVAEYLAAGPTLLNDWRDGWAPGTNPRGAALVSVAVDARRAGYYRGLRLEFLQQLHERYLHGRGGMRLRPESWEEALAWAAHARNATSSLLVPEDGSRYAAFDYLPDAVDADPDAIPVPDFTWEALIQEADSADAVGIGQAASACRRWSHARAAFSKAVAGGYLGAAVGLADCVGEAYGDEPAAVDVLTGALAAVQDDGGGLDTAVLLQMRRRLAWWTGHAGAPAEALQIMHDVVADSARLLGPEHPETIACRRNSARWTGQAGDPQLAWHLAQQVLQDSARLFGADHETTLSARFEVAVWTGQTGARPDAIRLWQALAADTARVLARDAEFAAAIGMNLAGLLRQQGEEAEAVEVLSRTITHLGEHAPAGESGLLSIRLRSQLAWSTGMAGAPAQALALARDVAADTARLLGADHLETISSRIQIARWTGDTGDIGRALSLADDAYTDALRIFGAAHRTTLSSRFEVALWTGYGGNAEAAVQAWRALETDASAVPDLAAFAREVRRNLAYWLFIVGRPDDGLALLRRVCAEHRQAEGHTSLSTLAARIALAHATGQLRQPAEALELAKAAVADCANHLGNRHEIALNGRFEMAQWTGECGDPDDAAVQFSALITDATQALGDNHRLTLDCRDELDRLTAAACSAPNFLTCWLRLARW
jgi:eukaryotic-like serine/threonine-protein kinase